MTDSTEKENEKKITEADEGCYADCSRGGYIGLVIITTALDHGWDGGEVGELDENGDTECPEAWIEYLRSSSVAEHDFYDELQSEAEEYLNTYQCPSHYYWGPAPNEDGSWGLWKRTNCAECSRDFESYDEDTWPLCYRCDRRLNPCIVENDDGTMTLKHPCVITPRLMPGVKVYRQGGLTGWISMEYSDAYDREGRQVYRYHIDMGDGQEYTGEDLRSGACGPFELIEGLRSLLSFLGAAAEQGRPGREPDDDDIFADDPRVTAWCYQHSDELSMLATELGE